MPPEHRALPPVVAARLGAEGSARALLLRRRLSEAGIHLPRWIDERPGHLRVIIGDLCDAPLSRTGRTLALDHTEIMLTGLGALALAAAAPRMALVTAERSVQESVQRALYRRVDQEKPRGSERRGTRGAVEVVLAPAVWPPQPDLDVPRAAGRALVMGAAVLDRAAAALLEGAPRRLCTVAGEVATPQVVALGPGETTAQLVARCGGATTAAWVPVLGGAPGGRLGDPDEPIGEQDVVLILPAGHEIVRRLRRAPAEWLRAAAGICAGCQLCTQGCPQALRGHPLFPHALVLRAAAFDGLPAEPAARDCTGCGACDVLCPAGLSPSRVVTLLAAQAGPAAGRDDAVPLRPVLDASKRRLPLSLLTAQLGLAPYLRE